MSLPIGNNSFNYSDTLARTESCSAALYRIAAEISALTIVTLIGIGFFYSLNFIAPSTAAYPLIKATLAGMLTGATLVVLRHVGLSLPIPTLRLQSY